FSCPLTTLPVTEVCRPSLPAALPIFFPAESHTNEGRSRAFRSLQPSRAHRHGMRSARVDSRRGRDSSRRRRTARAGGVPPAKRQDRKSTRLNSSHVKISYAVVCLTTK